MANCQKSSSMDVSWAFIWNIKAPPKIKYFLWLLQQDKLLTNDQRVKRKMTMTANCDICGAPMENAAHIVRNCPVAISVWLQSLMPMNLSLLQAVDLHTWVAKNLHNSTILAYGVEWSTMFAFTCWFL
ncbi:unnamed protein product [Prunus armeniaca]|uniref:Reverse transcriptase zinc-binding domain-containing protein n=1 Tax=Prunus armeniaca TaxID=36596 RepID=A0A6J5WS68_PRUAR|nr:unnamed protein product [Prunus armeniaca]